MQATIPVLPDEPLLNPTAKGAKDREWLTTKGEEEGVVSLASGLKYKVIRKAEPLKVHDTAQFPLLPHLRGLCCFTRCQCTAPHGPMHHERSTKHPLHNCTNIGQAVAPKIATHSPIHPDRITKDPY